MLIVEEYSPLRTITAEALDKLLCAPFGHRFRWQWSLCQVLFRWEDAATKTLTSTPIDRETADKLAHHPDSWTWMDEED